MLVSLLKSISVGSEKHNILGAVWTADAPLSTCAGPGHVNAKKRRRKPISFRLHSLFGLPRRGERARRDNRKGAQEGRRPEVRAAPCVIWRSLGVPPRLPGVSWGRAGRGEAGEGEGRRLGGRYLTTSVCASLPPCSNKQATMGDKYAGALSEDVAERV